MLTVANIDAFRVLGLMVRVKLPSHTAALAIATAFDRFETAGWDNVDAKALPNGIFAHFARILAIFKFELGTIGDRAIISDIHGKALCWILMPMQLAVCVVHRELLVIRIVISSTCVELQDTPLGVRILDGNA